MDNRLIEQLWSEHKLAPFPAEYRGVDVNGVDMVMLDADVAGCVSTFVSRGKLNLFQTAILGLCYRNLTCSIPVLSEEGKTYYRRLELLAQLVLEAVAISNKKNHERHQS